MSDHDTFRIRCRGVILHEGKLLVVRHAHDASFVALPGGHLEWGEDVQTCIRREIVEELGIVPVIGRLLYVNTFHATHSGVVTQPFEFFFEITNGAEYLDCEKCVRTHAHEIAEITWISPADEVCLLPTELHNDFKNGILGTDAPRYINGINS